MSTTLEVTVPSANTQVIAMSSGKRMRRVASGRKLSTVLEKARKEGHETDPVVFFVPKKNVTHIL